jgi:hypothetical protein
MGVEGPLNISEVGSDAMGESIPCRPIAPAIFPISNAKISNQNQCVQIRQTEQFADKISTPCQVNRKVCSQNQCLVQIKETIHSKIRLIQIPGNSEEG